MSATRTEIQRITWFDEPFVRNWAERLDAIAKCGAKAEITRFKGLGEISPDEFKHFIGKNIRLSPVVLNSDTNVQQLLNYYMGGNTPERQSFIMKHLKVEEDLVRDA